MKKISWKETKLLKVKDVNWRPLSLKKNSKKAVFESYPECASGLDGLSFLLYHHFWGVVKTDLMEMFKDFHSGDLDIFRINFAAIT
jgi:hypothetical protein